MNMPPKSPCSKCNEPKANYIIGGKRFCRNCYMDMKIPKDEVEHYRNFRVQYADKLNIYNCSICGKPISPAGGLAPGWCCC